MNMVTFDSDTLTAVLRHAATLEKLKEAHHQTYSDQTSAKQTGLGAFESVANPQTSSDVSTQLLILLTTLQKELLLPCNCGEAGIDGTSTVPETH